MDTQYAENSLYSLVHKVVAAEAPEELIYLDDVMAIYVADPAAMHIRPGGKSEMLGFGVADVAVIVGPILLAVLSDLAVDGVKFSSRSIWSWLRRRRSQQRAPDPSAAVPAYSSELIRMVQADVSRRLRAHGKTAEQAKAIAEQLGHYMGGP